MITMSKAVLCFIACLLFSISTISASPTTDDEALRKSAQRIHDRSILVDGHNDITLFMSDAGYDLAEPSAGLYHTDLARLKEGGVGAGFFSLWIDPAKYATNGAATRALKLIDTVYQAVAHHPRELVLATSVDEI